ncbi:MAG: hypothetical protein P4L42_12260 [Desulfocapsaceae bacterium]|nr:hypothetical protein [Desulfocapsaceae bacterium]
MDIQFPNGTSQPVQVIGVDDITLSGLPPLKKNLSSERNRLTVVVVTTARGVSPQILAGRIKERTGLKARSADDLKKTPSGGFRPTPKTLATSPPCFPRRLQSTSA